MKRQIIVVAMSAAFGIVASGCAGSDPSPPQAEDSAYCGSFADSEAAFRDMASGHVVDLETAFVVVHDLAAQSPPAISSQWATLDGAFVTLEKALEEAGMTVEQLDAVVSEGAVPEGIDVFEMQRLLGQMERFGSTDFARAASTIEQYGRDVCDVDLSS